MDAEVNDEQRAKGLHADGAVPSIKLFRGDESTMALQRDDAADLHERVNRAGDRISALEAAMSATTVRGAVMVEQLNRLSQTAATREQLESAVETVGLKLENLQSTMDPIKKAVYWVIGLILTSVFVAILALVIRQP